MKYKLKISKVTNGFVLTERCFLGDVNFVTNDLNTLLDEIKRVLSK